MACSVRIPRAICVLGSAGIKAGAFARPRTGGRAAWEADEVQNDLRAYVVEHLGDPEGVLIVKETGFLKKGQHSVGVQRQYSGTAGRIENCQIGVLLVYYTVRGHTFLDRALYLPRSWTDQAQRCQAVGIPPTVAFATKPVLARRMLQRALDAGVFARCVTADSVYGSDSQFRHFLESRPLAYVLGVASDSPLHPDTAGMLADQLAPQAWQRHRMGAGVGSGPIVRHKGGYVPPSRSGRGSKRRGDQTFRQSWRACATYLLTSKPIKRLAAHTASLARVQSAGCQQRQ
jgi:SRSO17 transposase